MRSLPEGPKSEKKREAGWGRGRERNKRREGRAE